MDVTRTLHVYWTVLNEYPFWRKHQGGEKWGLSDTTLLNISGVTGRVSGCCTTLILKNSTQRFLVDWSRSWRGEGKSPLGTSEIRQTSGFHISEGNRIRNGEQIRSRPFLPMYFVLELLQAIFFWYQPKFWIAPSSHNIILKVFHGLYLPFTFCGFSLLPCSWVSMLGGLLQQCQGTNCYLPINW